MMHNNQGNQFINILLNIVIPVIILTKFSGDNHLGALYGLIAALALPFLYGIYGFIFHKRANYIALIGFAGVLLTGVIGLFQFSPQWIAVKEAAIPLIIGVIILISTKTSWQIITRFIYNRELLDIDRIEANISTPKAKIKLSTAINRANRLLAGSFFFSATLNYILAKIIVRSMPGTLQFNEEIGKMTMLSFPVIVLPSVIIMMFILWYLFSTIKTLTRLSSDELFAEKLKSNKRG